MNKELIQGAIHELQETKKLCQMLMESPHYKKIGAEGIFAVVEMAKSVGVDPLQALNGGMFFVRGKVEMSSMLMNSLIRQAGHSITKDKESNENICILHGKRADTGDTWIESFSIEDAKAAKLNSPTWTAYRRDMLFARALSRLARQLFPDVIKGAYIQGEISMDTAINSRYGQDTAIPEPITETLGEEGALELAEQLGYCQSYAKDVKEYLDRKGLQLKDLPLDHAERIKDRIYKIMHSDDDDGPDIQAEASIEAEENFESERGANNV